MTETVEACGSLKSGSVIISFERVFAIGNVATAFFLLKYVYLVSLRQWDYLGFPVGEYSELDVGKCLLLAVLPACVIPLRIGRLSAFVNWWIYYFVYLPAVLFPLLQGLRKDVIDLAIALCLGFLAIILITNRKAAIHSLRLPRRVFWLLFGLSYLSLAAYAAHVLGNSIAFAGIGDVYEQRALAGDAAEGTLVGYCIGILSGCLNPFLLSLGFRYRNGGFLALGIAAQILTYATFAMKATLLSIPVTAALYLVCLRRDDITWRGLATFNLCLLLLPLVTGAVLSEEMSDVIDNVGALVYMRTYGMAGGLTGTYFDFFSQNQYTYFSHINVVGKLLEYPYAKSIGEVIGDSMGFEMNANANFFATDGIAALGLFGVVLIGVIVGFIFRGLDSLIPSRNLRLACGASGPSMANLSNTSIFTTLLTGGLFFLAVLCSLWRRRE